MKNQQFLSLLLLLSVNLIFWLKGQAQEFSPPNVKTYPLFKNESEWGSSARFVNDFLVDREGLLWLGTNSGLIRWDGQYETPYNKKVINSDSGEGKAIYRLFEVNDGNILLLDHEKLMQLEILDKELGLRRTISFPSEEYGESDFIADIIQTPQGEVYALVNRGNSTALFWYRSPGKIQMVSSQLFPFDLRNKTIQMALYEEAIWLAIDGSGVWRDEGEGVKLILPFTEKGTSNAEFIYSDRKGRLWLGLSEKKGLYQYSLNKRRFVPYDVPEELSFQQIKEDTLGNLLFAQRMYPDPLGAMYLLKDEQWMDLSGILDTTARNYFSAGNFEKHLFQTTANNIVTKSFVNPHVRPLLQTQEKGTWGDIIKGIEEDDKGNIYFLEEINGFFRLNKATGQTERIPVLDKEGREFRFRCGGRLHRGELGDLWFKVCDGETNGYLVRYRINTEQFDFYPMGDLPRDITLDKDRRIWIAYHDVKDHRGKILYFDPGEEQFYPLLLADENGLDYFPEPRFIQQTADSLLWIGTVEGLVRVNKETGEQRIYNVANSRLENDYIILIEEMENGHLLLGSSGGGLFTFDPVSGTVNSYRDKGPANGFVCGALPAKKGHWWISTFNGLAYWDPTSDIFFDFDKTTQGFSHHEFNRYAYHLSSDGQYYFGNVNGVSAFRTEDLLGQGPVPALGLHSVEQYSYGTDIPLLLTEEQIAKDQVLGLSQGVSHIQFNFYVGDYLTKNTSKLQVKLEGYEDEWQVSDEQKRMTYRYLPPGNYKLMARGYSGSGVPAATTFALPLRIPKPIYQRWWFWGLIFVALLGLAWLISSIRIKNLRKRAAEKNEVTRKLAELELQALRAQLNPHFVSNVLGAIQHTIREQDTVTAEMTLTKFAHLMRLFLESSKNKYITLAEELELIRYYVEIELLRFKDRFEFILDVPEYIDEYAIEVPSLLFQPFIENAINHGLFHKKDKGRLLVSFKLIEQQTMLLCVIEDDGIGRKKAAEIKKQSIRNYRSRATQIVNERLEILKTVEDLQLDIQIIDMYDGGDAKGTRVEIRIPVE